MNDRRITFERSIGGDWRTEVDGEIRSLCVSGVLKYVGLPAECVAFDAVFTVNRDDHDDYELGPTDDISHPTLDIADDPDFYGEIKALMNVLYHEGYRHMHVEYENG